jgi:hypothetical protein
MQECLVFTERYGRFAYNPCRDDGSQTVTFHWQTSLDCTVTALTLANRF